MSQPESATPAPYTPEQIEQSRATWTMTGINNAEVDRLIATARESFRRAPREAPSEATRERKARLTLAEIELDQRVELCGDPSVQNAWRQYQAEVAASAGSQGEPSEDTKLLDRLEARGVVSVLFSDGREMNPGILSLRAATRLLTDRAVSRSGADHAK